MLLPLIGSSRQNMSLQTPLAARPVQGMAWMILTGLLFVAVTAVVKHLGNRIPAPETAFLRYVLGLVFLIPMLRPMMREGLSMSSLRLFGARGVVHALGVMLWFYAMTQISIAEVTSMSYFTPIYATLGAAVLLGERLAARRITAILIALLGALVILRPGFQEISSGHIAMLGNGVCFAMSFLIAKVMADRVHALVVVGWLSVFVTIALFPFALAVWTWPTWEELGWLFLVAALATAGHYTMTLALRAAPIAVTQPATFLQLVWATALGAAIFAEPVDGWVILGGVLICASVSFIALREAALKRRSSAIRVEPTKL